MIIFSSAYLSINKKISKISFYTIKKLVDIILIGFNSNLSLFGIQVFLFVYLVSYFDNAWLASIDIAVYITYLLFVVVFFYIGFLATSSIGNSLNGV